MKKKLFLVLIVLAMVVVVGFTLTACDKASDLIDGILPSEPKNIQYNGATITWDKNNGADHYLVSVNSGTQQRTNTNSFAYSSTESFNVTVIAVYDGKEKTTSMTFTALGAVSNIVVGETGVVSWDSVQGANAYLVNSNGTETTVTTNQIADLEGNNRIKIKPIVQSDNSYFGEWSDFVNVSIYKMPTNIKYDGSEISWTGNSVEYDVKVNGISSVVRGNKFAYASDNKDFSVEIIALGNQSTSFNSKPAIEEFNYLTAITNVFVEDGLIKWNEIDRAEKYKIKINGIVQNKTVTINEFADLSAGASHDIAVMPVNESGNYFSSWSQEKTVYILETPTVTWNNDLELDGEANNNFVWDAVSAADGYTVALSKNGEFVDTFTYSDIQRAFAYGYTDVAVYSVKVKSNAPSGNSNYYDSKYSDEITIKRLPAPKAATSDFIVSDKGDLSKGFTVNYLNVEGANGYQLYKDSVLLNGKFTQNGISLSDNNLVDTSNVDEQNYTYTVRSMGGVKTVSGKKVVTLPCLSTEALSFNIKVQATPQNPVMSGFILSWDSVVGNAGYSVVYAGKSLTSQTENFDLSTIKAGTYSVSVNARGNGSNVLASTPSAPVEIERLEAPTEIKISSESDGTLQYREVANATGYQVYLDLSENALDETSFTNMYHYIESNGTTLSMVAVANKYNDDETLYYMTSQTSPTQQFIRLASPTFPEGALSSNNELLWNAPSNINTSEYTPSYKIYSAHGEQIGGGSQNGTKFNIEYLEGGRTHNFYIKAIGNDTKYLDSDYSVLFDVYKLATPEISIVDGNYVWNGVANASSYYMEIDGEKVTDEFHSGTGLYTFTPRFTTAGEHIVTLKAVGDGKNNADSATFVHTQKAKILETPEIEYHYSNDQVVNGGSIVVNITTPSPNCNKYQYGIGGESITSEDLSFSKVIEGTGDFAISVRALGGSFDSAEIYYVDSQYAGGGSADTITLLGTPSTSLFSINSDGVIKWGSISGSFGYEYKLSYNNGAFGEVTNTAYSNLNPINDYKQYSSISIMVRAKGSADGKTIASEWQEWTWTNSMVS